MGGGLLGIDDKRCAWHRLHFKDLTCRQDILNVWVAIVKCPRKCTQQLLASTPLKHGRALRQAQPRESLIDDDIAVCSWVVDVELCILWGCAIGGA
jgi:hypothetical protein